MYCRHWPLRIALRYIVLWGILSLVYTPLVQSIAAENPAAAPERGLLDIALQLGTYLETLPQGKTVHNEVRRHLAAGQQEEALKLLKASLESWLGEPALQELLQRLATGQAEAARNFLKASLESLREQAVQAEALQVLEAGQGEKARELLEAYLDTSPNSSWAWRALVIVYRSLARGEELVLRLDRLLTTASDPGPFAFARGYLAFQLDDLLGAKSYIEQSLQAGYQKPLVLNLAGVIEERLGNLEQSLHLLHEALVAEPTLEMGSRNLLRVRTADIMRRALQTDLWKDPAAAEALATQCRAIYATGMEPLRNVHIVPLPEVFGERRGLVIDAQTEDRGYLRLFFDPPLTAGALDVSYASLGGIGTGLTAHYYPKKELLLVKQTLTTGFHHAQVRLSYMTAKGTLTTIEHEWQIPDALEERDLNGDGIPELVIDLSQYYVKSFADGIVDFDFVILRYNEEREAFEYVPLLIDIPGINAGTRQLNATAIAAARQGDWRRSQKLFERALAFSNNPDLRWNALIVAYHAEAFKSQYRKAPSAITAALLGAPDAIKSPKAFQDLRDLSPVRRMFASALHAGWKPERLRALLSSFYVSGISPSALLPQSLTQQIMRDSRSLVHPESRALESAALSYIQDRLMYIPPGVGAATLSRVLKSQNVDQMSEMLVQAAPSDFSQFAVNYTPNALSEWLSSSRLIEKSIVHNDSASLIGRLVTLLRRKDFEQAQRLIQRISAIWPDDPSVRSALDYAQRIIDLRYGRYYDVVMALRGVKEPQQELNSYEAFEKLHIFSVPEAVYQEALDHLDQATVLMPVVVQEHLAYLGLGRIAFSQGDYPMAKERLLKALNVLYRLSLFPYHQITYPATLLWLARTELKLGNLDMARAYNATAYYAASHTGEQGTGFISSASQYDFELLPQVFFNDFLLARAAGNDRLAMAFLMAAISIMQDIYRLTPDYVDQLGISETAHAIYREAVRFHLMRGRPKEAFVLLNAVKETTALRQLLRRLESASASQANLLLPSFDQVSAPLRSTNTTVVQYFVMEDVVGIFVLRSSGQLAYVEVPLNREQLRLGVEKTLDLTLELHARERRLDLEQQLRWLYEQLLTPVAALLPPEGAVLIIPDRELYPLPFDMLLGPSGRYLIEDHPLLYASSLSSLNAIVAPGKSIKEDVLLVHSPQTVQLAPLIYSAVEAAKIQALLGPARVEELAGSRATLDHFTARVAQKTLIHVATHTIVDARRPQQSVIVLGEGGAAPQGLTLADLFAGRVAFKKTPMVVLSSCASAVGKIYEEGVVGLVYGLFLSGASTVVVTQWEVVDAEVPSFMEQFYRHYLQDHDVARALREAKVQAIHKGLHPQTWAPFVVFGKPLRKDL